MCIYIVEKESIARHLAGNRQRQTAQFSEACRLAVSLNDHRLLVGYVKFLKPLQQETDDLVYAYFAGIQGTIIAHTTPHFNNRPLTTWSWDTPSGVTELYKPIILHGRRVGTAVIGYSETSARTAARQALDSLAGKILFGASLSALICLILGAGFSYFLVKPLGVLIRSFAEVEEGNFSAEVSLKRNDEIGELLVCFNRMVRKLAVLDELKNEFIRSVSHDLRNPMSAIKMHVDYMLNTDPDCDLILPKHRKILLTIMDASTSLGIYVTNILDVAKMKAGRMEYFCQPVDAGATLMRVFSLYESVSQRRNITLAAEVEPDLPEIYVDPERFDNVIANLISNSMKFTKPGGRITAGASRVGDAVAISIADTGKGIPATDLPSLFQPFFQSGVAEQRSKRTIGTGLGLYSVKQTVEALGGVIAIASSVNVGTRITLTLPAVKAAARSAPPQEKG
jgi:signal transduction histidine kinase